MAVTTDHHPLLDLRQAAKQSPVPISYQALWRWARQGVAARNGGKVRLKHVRVGGRLYTRQDWIDQFSKALADADAEHFDDAATAPAHGRRTALNEHLDAEAELEREGL